jgi:hypothetical protein
MGSLINRYIIVLKMLKKLLLSLEHKDTSSLIKSTDIKLFYFFKNNRTNLSYIGIIF